MGTYLIQTKGILSRRANIASREHPIYAVPVGGWKSPTSATGDQVIAETEGTADSLAQPAAVDVVKYTLNVAF